MTVDIDSLTLKQIREISSLTKSQRTKQTERERYVIVRAYSGVFFGKLVARRGDEIELHDVRHIYSWTSAGLARKAITVEDIATVGIGKDSKISGVCSAVTIFEVRVIADCTDIARRVITNLPCT